MSIGLSLGCLVIGFNGGLEEKLYELQSIEPPIPSYVTQLYFLSQVKLDRYDRQRNQQLEQVTAIGRAMEQHYTMLLLSILCFYLALLGLTAYSIYSSVFIAKSFTIRYAFYVMAAGGLLITMGIILRWNRQFSQ